jgi:RimJ/RimL family protein N-acetyltransferase
MTAQMPDLPTILRLDELVLRPWRPDDVARLHAAGQDPEVARWVHLSQPFRVEEATAYLGAAMALWQDGSGASFAIVDQDDTGLLGAVTRFGPEGHAATIGLWLVPSARGRGVGTRTLRHVIDWTFATTETVRIDCYIEVGNEPSMRMVERAGFRREGLLRAWETGPDGPIDCVVWSVLRTDERDPTEGLSPSQVR